VKNATSRGKPGVPGATCWGPVHRALSSRAAHPIGNGRRSAIGRAILLIAFITEPGRIRKILTHLGEPLEPPPLAPARGPPADWGELVQASDERDVFQASPDDLPVIDIHSL